MRKAPKYLVYQLRQKKKSLIESYKERKLLNLDKSQWWSLKKLTDFQNKRLKAITNYAYNQIPAYRRKFREAGITPRDILFKDDILKLPVTTRKEMQSNPDFVNEPLIRSTLFTGGSTGTSLRYYESHLAKEMRMNVHFRGWEWNGYRSGKRLAVIASAQGAVQEKNVLTLLGDLTKDNLRLTVEKLANFRPEHFRGYTSSLYLLAKYCLDNNIQIEGIQSINPISENLYDFQRETMEQAFNCEVFEEYCCNDGGACAWECEKHEGLHYVMERAIIEEIDGEMIVTDLWNLAMPFIRYRNGDSVKWLDKKCSCGRELPLITVKGRTNDILISPYGPISPSYLMLHGIKYDAEHHRSGISAAQYVQKPGYKVDVNIVKNPWCLNKEIEELENDLSEILKGMQFNVNFVDTIPTTKKGKRSFIINEDENLLRQFREGTLKDN